MQAVPDMQNLSLRNFVAILFCQSVCDKNLSVLFLIDSFAFYYTESPKILIFFWLMQLQPLN